MLKHPVQTEERIRQSLERIRPLIHPQRAPLEGAVWHVHGEPVAPEVGLRANYSTCDVGEPWGGLWDTSWFRFRGKIPKSWKGCEVVALVKLTDVGREGFTAEGLVFQKGVPVRALNANRSEIAIEAVAEGGEKFEFFVEAAANGGTSDWGVTTSLNLPDYNGATLYRLAQAELACIDREAFALYYDFKVALEAMETLPTDSQGRAEFRQALNEAVNRLDVSDSSTVKLARDALREVLSRKNGHTAHTVTAVGHAHIDSAWLWPLRETIRKCARTFSTALDYMDEYPDYVFVCSQAQQYAWMKAYYPEIWQRIKKAVRRGQWEPVGSMWVEPDCNIPSGESLIRQILYGKRFFKKELQYETKDVWIPDVFGYSASLPQIMAKSGVRYFLTQKISWNQFNVFPHNTFFWEGIDGSRIFSHFLPSDTYNADTGPKEIIKNVRNFKDHGQSTCSLLAYGYGDGGGGPSIEMLEKASRLKDLDGLPKVELEGALTFFEKASGEVRDLSVWVGELYLELHRGTYTSQAKNKLGNRRSENLLREAEFFDAVTLLINPSRKQTAVDPPRAVYDVTGLNESKANLHRSALERAWKLVLLNQFHDIIPGSSIHLVYQDSARDYETIRVLGESVRDSALAALEPLIDTSTFRRPLFLANPLGFAREETIRLYDGSLSVVEVPACGYCVVDIEDLPKTPEWPVKAEQIAKGIVMENAFVRLEISPQGQLVSVYDLRAEREVLDGPGNVFELHEDIPNVWDAWDVDVFYREKSRSVGSVEVFALHESNDFQSTVRVVRTFGNSRIEQFITLSSGSGRIDFSTRVNWRERQKLLRVAFPVAIRALSATYEIQYGHVERPTHYNTSWDLGKFEVCAQKWVDLSESGYGVALLNDCKYGHDIHENVIRLSLLRAPISPDPVADQGHHEFTYSLFPHAGNLRESGVIENASMLNAPLIVRESVSRAGKLPAAQSFFSVEGAGVQIETVKTAEDGKAIIVRLYEAHGGRKRVTLRTSLPVREAWTTDLLEQEISQLGLQAGAVAFDIVPFEIVTLKFIR
jgi:alpha-mannosidase